MMITDFFEIEGKTNYCWSGRESWIAIKKISNYHS